MPRIYVRLLTGLLIVSLFTCGTLWACQVPVFRYALERWAADPYIVLIISEGELSSAEIERAEKFKQVVESKPQLELESVDVSKSQSRLHKYLWERHRPESGALVVITYPRNSRIPPGEVAFSGALLDVAPESLLASPVSDEIVSKLASGSSAVWILLESGDSKKDDEAFARLKTQLSLDEKRVQVPTAEEMEIEPELLGQAKIDLKIEFPVMRLSRKESSELLLVESLLGSEPDLRSFEEPLAFPVFGRGRVLYALVGDGIQSNVIASATDFMVGPCSCQVKDQNPGFDLLTRRDWDSLVGKILISDPIPETTNQPRLLQIPPGNGNR